MGGLSFKLLVSDFKIIGFIVLKYWFLILKFSEVTLIWLTNFTENNQHSSLPFYNWTEQSEQLFTDICNEWSCSRKFIYTLFGDFSRFVITAKQKSLEFFKELHKEKFA